MRRHGADAYRAPVGTDLRCPVARARAGHDAVAEVARGGLLLRASAEPLLEGDGRAVRRAGAPRQRGTRGVHVGAARRAVGRAGLVHHRGRLRCLHFQCPPERPLAHRLGRAARSRVHHGLEGDGALPALLCRHASGRAARGLALHEPRERPHAPGRPRGGVPAAPGRAAPKRLRPGALACATAGRRTFRQSYHRLPRPVAREAADAGRRQTGVVACERSYFSAFSGWPWSFCQRSQVE